MKSKALMLACGLLLMPFMATAEPLRWRDGYMDLRGNFFKADWRTFKADSGTTFAVDMRSIAHIGSSGGNVKVVAYLTEGDDFDPNNLISFAFDCKGVIEIVSNASIARVRPVEEQVRELACH